MRSWAALPVALGALVVGIAAGGSPQAPTVVHITDGDTLTVSPGGSVRLLQIDTPELGGGECFSRAAARELRLLAPVGSAVTLQADAQLDGKDRYGRLLRYVKREGGYADLSYRQAWSGFTRPYVFGGTPVARHGTYVRAIRDARSHQRGAWNGCW